MLVAISLHVLAAIIWVGGMFFAYLVLRPASADLPPPERLSLWAAVLKRFFPWVWLSILVLLASGYYMILIVFGGFGNTGMHIHSMQGIGILMMALFMHLFFSPYRRLLRAVHDADWSLAGAQINQIRRIVGINLLLGIIVAVIASGGRYFH